MIKFQTVLNLAGFADVKIKTNTESAVKCYQNLMETSNAIESGVSEKHLRRTVLLYGGNDVYQQITKTIKSVLLKRRKKQEKIRNFIKTFSNCDIEMADENQTTPDQSHLLDETTIPLVDIASSVTSTEEEVIVEPEKEKNS